MYVAISTHFCHHEKTPERDIMDPVCELNYCVPAALWWVWGGLWCTDETGGTGEVGTACRGRVLRIHNNHTDVYTHAQSVIHQHCSTWYYHSLASSLIVQLKVRCTLASSKSTVSEACFTRLSSGLVNWILAHTHGGKRPLLTSSSISGLDFSFSNRKFVSWTYSNCGKSENPHTVINCNHNYNY